MDLAEHKKNDQQARFGPAVAKANPLGDVIYVDSTNGSDGWDGHSKLRAKASIFGTAGALSAAEAGDTIIVTPGGTETIAAAKTISVAGVSIICPAATPHQGYEISCSADVDAIKVSAARVTIRGLQIKHTGSSTNRAGIIINAVEDVAIVACVFNSAGVAGKTDYGVKIVSGSNYARVEGCVFKNPKYGVYVTNDDDGTDDTTSTTQPAVVGNEFLVGTAAGWGVYTDGAGQVNGLLIAENDFYECDGTAGSDNTAWDGTAGNDGTQGPVKFAATSDRTLVRDNRAFTAQSVTFANLCNAVSGSASQMVENYTATTS